MNLRSRIVSSAPRQDRRNTIARLDEPVPLLGLRLQRLGLVQALVVSLDTQRILEVELHTPWQTLCVRGEAVHYDADRGVFCLLPSRVLPSRGINVSQAGESAASS